jgi:hypothetical protein
MGVLAFLPIIGKVLDKVLPDKGAREAAQLQVLELAQRGELAELEADVRLAIGQMEINKVEAANPSVFVSGWRPFVGWVCAFGMGSQFVFGPFFEWGSALLENPTPWPKLDLAPLLTMLGGMLGLGAMRTVEKIKDVARS